MSHIVIDSAVLDALLAAGDATARTLGNRICSCKRNVPYDSGQVKQVVTEQCARCTSLAEWQQQRAAGDEGGSVVSERVYQPGDRVEWDASPGPRVLRGTIETVGTGRHEGIVMVRQDGYVKSRPVSRSRLRDSKSKTPAPMRGGDAA